MKSAFKQRSPSSYLDPPSHPGSCLCNSKLTIYCSAMAWSKLSLSTLSTCFKKSECGYLNPAIIIAIIATFFDNMQHIHQAKHFISVALDFTCRQTCILLLQIQNLKVHLTSKQYYSGRFQKVTRPRTSTCTNMQNYEHVCLKIL